MIMPTSHTWTFKQEQFFNEASRSVNGQTTEVTVTEVDVDIVTTVGRGFLAETHSSYVPIEVLIKLLEHVGFSVTRR